MMDKRQVVGVELHLMAVVAGKEKGVTRNVCEVQENTC
jgi:hypothetical protein